MVRQTENGSVPVQELKTPAMVSIRKFAKSVLIVLLSFACIFTGMLIYQLRFPDEEFHPSAVDKKHASPLLRKPVATSSPVMVEKKAGLPSPVEGSMMNSVFVTVPQKESEQKPAVPSPAVEAPKPIEEQSASRPIEPAKAISSIPSEPMLPLEVALNLRDHLAMGISCFPEFKDILKNRVPAEINRERLIEDLMPVCTNQTIFEDMGKVFKENKKRALMTYYLLNNPVWLAYLKTVATTLVDIRRLHPLKQKPKDIISLAQNALMAHQVSEAQNYIQKLPSEMKDDFSEFLRLSAVYIKAQQVTDKLILSFEKKGE